MSLQLTELVKRPGVGKVGKPIRVRANFFEVTAFANHNFHHYDVTIDPADTKPTLIPKIWKEFEDANQQAFGGIKTVFDGRKNVFSPKPLPLGEQNAKQFEVELPAGKRGTDKFIIRMKKANEVNMEELRRFLVGQAPCTSNVLTAIMVLDVLLRHVPSNMYVKIGNSFYTPNEKRPLPNAAEVWQGYYQSARPTVGKMMINIDVSATAFYEAGPLPEIAVKILGRRSIDDFRRGISERDVAKLKTLLKKVRVCIVHRGDKKVTQTITGLTPTPASHTVFKDQDGKEMTVAEYFLKQYNKRLNYPFLPCVVARKNIFFPMEVCEVLPGQRLNAKLNDKQLAEMIKFTCQKPNVRANKIREGMNLLQYKDNPYMQQFGVAVKPEMAVVNARVLPTPKVAFHPSCQESEFAPQAGAWSLRGKKLAQAATLGSWSIVNFAGGVPPQAIQRFVRELCQAFSDLGLNVTNRQPPLINADPNGDVERTLKEAWLKAGNAAKAQPQLIFCILPFTNIPVYGVIKHISDTILGVPTQCVQSKHVADAKKQYCANVCLKVNVKLGGMNFHLAPPNIPFIAQRPTIVIGADVTHPGPGDFNKPSIAALAASMDARSSRYCSSIRVQANRTEIIADLANMVKEVLKNFYQSCGQKPERILFYRDGVSEGQFKQVMEFEVAAIRAACASLDKSYKPTLTFVVVQKRHHARFFAMGAQDADRTGNLMPGTVVDTDVVHPFEFDFYLQSHAGLQGTCRPTHYHVLYDDNKFTPDSLQELTYNLCYSYARATRSVSIVPAVYYADLIAARARYHRRGENWSDADFTSESLDSEAQMASFSVVKPELQKLMYFM